MSDTERLYDRRGFESLAYVDIRGLRYAYRRTEIPNTPILVCLHGLMDTGASFIELAERLNPIESPGFDMLAPDWRGHGHTSATPGGYWFPNYLADLEALLDRLTGSRRVVLIGHSMGGQIASLYAGLRPDRVAGLITLDSLNMPDSDPTEAPRRYRGWLDARRAERTGHADRARTYPSRDALAQRLARRYPELSPDQQYRLARRWLIPTEHNDRWQLHIDPDHRRPMPYAFRLAESKAIWREVAAPVLCIDGGASPARRRLGDTELATRRACFADMTHYRLDDCGHMLLVEAPDRVASMIRSFIENRVSL